jgi:hypothetical protein
MIVKGLALAAKPHAGRRKQLTDAELMERLQRWSAKTGKIQVGSRADYLEAIGGDLRMISKKHRQILDSFYPEDRPTPKLYGTDIPLVAPKAASQISNLDSLQIVPPDPTGERKQAVVLDESARFSSCLPGALPWAATLTP